MPAVAGCLKFIAIRGNAVAVVLALGWGQSVLRLHRRQRRQNRGRRAWRAANLRWRGGRRAESIGGSGRINRPNRHAKELRAPALIVHCKKAHSRYFSEDVYKALLSKNRELYIILSASHTDLYDNQAGKIPYDKFEQFFKANLK